MSPEQQQAPPLRVLVVDDIEVNRRIRRALLESQGYTVEVAANGLEALAMAREQPPDLVVADVLMPEMDGFTLCREWKSDPRLQQIPFIFYTATYTREEDRDLAERLGADAYLTKSMDSQEFLRAVIDIADRALGKVRAISPPLKDEESYYKAYNLRVQEKLEEKIEDLQRANRAVLARERDLREAQELLERRIAERTASLIAANRELEAFAYSVSHDLRAPLRAIDGYTSLLAEGYGEQLDDNGRDLLARTRGACQRMGLLIDKLLELSRVTRREPQRTQVNLSSLVLEISEQLKAAEPERDLVFTITPDVVAECDAVLIRIVLENLLNNAAKYTGRRKIARIAFGVKEVDGERVYYVADNGAGFDPVDAGQLFTAFKRLHPERDFPGSGIGLATVQRIVDRHGGGVWAEGVLDKGATFSFSLPAVRERCGKETPDGQ